jgi:hypothetical protein
MHRNTPQGRRAHVRSHGAPGIGEYERDRAGGTPLHRPDHEPQSRGLPFPKGRIDTEDVATNTSSRQ